MLCFVVVMQSSIMNSHEVFIHIHQGCFAGTGAIVRLPQCQWSKPAGYGKISQCITTTKHSKAKTVCTFLGIYCMYIILSMCFMSCTCRMLYVMCYMELLWCYLLFVCTASLVSTTTVCRNKDVTSPVIIVCSALLYRWLSTRLQYFRCY